MREPLVDADVVAPPVDARAASHFFAGGGRGQALDQLEHLATWSRSIIMLTGPLGAGKTTLVARILSHIRLRNRTTIVEPPVGFLSNGEELLRHLLAGLSARAPEDADIATLKAMVVQNAIADSASDRSTLLVLDDAHELSVDVLRTIVDIVDEAKDSRAINVLLAGESSLSAHLEKAVGSKNLPYELKLKPLSTTEIKAFLLEKLGDETNRLDNTEVQNIARRSGGWPGAVLSEAGKELKKLDRKRGFPLVHLVWTSALVISLIALVLLQDEKPPERVSENLNLPGQTEQPTDDDLVVADDDTNSRVPVSVIRAPVTNNTTESAVPNDSTPSQASSEPTPPPKPAPTLRVHADTEWARSQAPNHFTIQLIGVSALASARQFIAEHDAKNLQVVRTQRGGQDWYLVVHGSFASRSEAQAAMPNLPSSDGTKPWVRTFEGIQSDLP